MRRDHANRAGSAFLTPQRQSVAALLVAFNPAVATLIYLPSWWWLTKRRTPLSRKKAKEDIANALKFSGSAASAWGCHAGLNQRKDYVLKML
ncbi:hypothetical protein KCP74_19620 [Salmonella enterica subsp. enterica]|nr:hypothetical protein KCP74_19620 [Salmonella enterica subsp. enterica]